jgi:DNA-directed RNA polymerase specialized sigma24 family protein
VAAVCNLAHAQRRLLRALGEVLRSRPDVVAAALRRVPSRAYWAFVLLYAARRGGPGRRPWPAGDEQPSPRSPPPEAAWPRLWSRTVAMDPAAGTPFLIERTRIQAERPQALGRILAERISALPDGPREVLYHYFHRDCSVAQVALLVGRPEAEVTRILHAFRQDVRQALGGDPATRIFLQPGAARAWDAFLAECLFWTWSGENYLFDPNRGEKYPELLLSHYGAAFDLLCPRSWN